MLLNLVSLAGSDDEGGDAAEKEDELEDDVVGVVANVLQRQLLRHLAAFARPVSLRPRYEPLLQTEEGSQIIACSCNL